MAYKKKDIMKAGEMFKKGKPISFIAKRFKVSMEQAARWKTRYELGCLCVPIKSEDIKAFFEQHPGVTYRQAAHQLGVHITTISNCLVKNGIRKISKKKSRDDLVRVYFMHHPEETNQEIGESIGMVPAGCVSGVLHRLGLRRPKKVDVISDAEFVEYVKEHPKKPYKMIALYFGASIYWVRCRMKKLGINRRRIDSWAEKEIVRLTRESPQMTHKEMAEAVGRSMHFVESVLRRNNVKDYWRGGRRAEAKKASRRPGFLPKKKN